MTIRLGTGRAIDTGIASTQRKGQLLSEMDYSRQYLHFHDGSDDHYRWHSKAAFAELKPYLPDDREAPILEIGCGMGFGVGGLVDGGYRQVRGIDSSPEQVAACHGRSLPVELVPVSETLAFLEANAGRFSFAYAIDVLEHIPPGQLIDVLRAIRGALVPGSMFLCRVPNANSALAARMRYIDWTHQVSFSETSLDFVLFNAGFSDVRVEETKVLMPGSPDGFAARCVRALFRKAHRMNLAVEHGRKLAATVPLTLNILGIGRA